MRFRGEWVNKLITWTCVLCEVSLTFESVDEILYPGVPGHIFFLSILMVRSF